MQVFVLLFILFFSTEIVADVDIEKSFLYSKNIKYEEKNVDTTVFPKKRPISERNIFIFNPNKLVWAVYDKNGDRVGIGKASGGKDYCADIHASCRTVEGEYTVFRKEDKDCTSKTFPIDEGGGAPMPHCMFFYKGYAIHGSSYIPNKNVSHGCIRVSKDAAKWMNENYIHEGSLVIVESYQ
ncbi:MAG: L,D-transpeptidase [Gammaproteobacteria bacterium]|nr:L,D-transpeptidase [Gammaproteobacteria bacterium]